MLRKILFINLFLFSFFCYSQEIRVDTIKTVKTKQLTIVRLNSVPKLILQVNGSLAFGALELNGSNGGFSDNDFITGKSFGARVGVGTELMFKLPLNKKGQFWLDISGGYNRFQSDMVASNQDAGKAYYNQLYWGLGAEYNFTPFHRVKYYAGTGSLFSIIGGNAKLLNSDKTTFRNVDIKSGFRIGYSLYTGLNYGLTKDIGWDLGIKFSHANLLLKKTTSSASENETELNDNAGSPEVLYSGWKQFAYTTVFTGISYYFGVKEKRYRLD